jgi:hypothetical protein
MHMANVAFGKSTAPALGRAAELFHFSKRITSRLATSHVDRDAIFKLRYQCYLRGGLIAKNSFGRYIDATDYAANTHLIGLYDDNKLISSLRLQISSPINPHFSSLELFPHVLEPLLKSNSTILDMSCVAAGGGSSGAHSWLPYLSLRSWIVAAEHFHADYIVTAARPQHLPFYQRTLGCELRSKLRQPPHRLDSVALVMLNFTTFAQSLYENLPFLRSTPTERQQVFERNN